MALRLRQWENQGEGDGDGEGAPLLLPMAEWRGDGVRKPGRKGQWVEVLWFVSLIAFGVLIMALTVVTSALDIVRLMHSDEPMSSC